MERGPRSLDRAWESERGTHQPGTATYNNAKDFRRLSNNASDRRHPPRTQDGRHEHALGPGNCGQTAPIIGTARDGNVRAMKARMVHVFTTRFFPDEDEETLSRYLKDKLKRRVECHKLSRDNHAGSFHVSAMCEDPSELYSMDVWPDGILVRRYRLPRARKENTRPVENGQAQGNWRMYS